MYKHPHIDPQRPMEYSLAGIWLLCLLLTAMEWLTPVEMVNHSLRIGAHRGVVLLFVYPISRLLAGFWLTKKLLRWLARLLVGGAALTFLSIIAWPLGGLLWPAIENGYDFFFGSNPWQTDYVHFRRGQEVMASQVRYVGGVLSGKRTVRLTPVTPFLQWVRPVPPVPPGRASQYFSYDRLSKAGPYTPGFAGWTRVGAAHQTEVHARDSANSQQLLAEQHAAAQAQVRRDAADARRRAAFAACVRTQWVEDSLTLLGRRPALQLPIRTRRGANTFGCRVGTQLWRDHGIIYTDAAGCVRESAWGYLDDRHALHVGARMRFGTANRFLELIIPHLTGPGTYRLARNDRNQPYYEDWAFEENPGSATQYHSAGVQVRISRFDPVTRVAAGTFQGYLYLYRPGVPDKLIPLRQGRFDVQF